MKLDTDDFLPTHTHADGGDYEVLGDAQLKYDDGWTSAIVYIDKDGKLYVREPDDFKERFTAIEQKVFAGNLDMNKMAALRDQLMTAGGQLLSIKPGALYALARAMEMVMTRPDAMVMTQVARRQWQKFIVVMRAAERYRKAAVEADAAFAIHDPQVKN